MSKKLENSVPTESELLDQLFELTPSPETNKMLIDMCRTKRTHPRSTSKRSRDFWNALQQPFPMIYTPLVKTPNKLKRRTGVLFVKSTKKSEGTIEIFCRSYIDDRIQELFDSSGHTARHKESFSFYRTKFSVPSLDVLIPILCFMTPEERKSIDKVVCHGSKEYLKEVKSFI